MAQYFVDSAAGNDGNAGTSAASPWKSLSKATAQTYFAGDQLLLKRGSVWNEPLKLKGRAEAGRVIELGTYGQGPRPQILAGGRDSALSNEGPISGWHIHGLELTNSRAGNPGGRIAGNACGIHFRQEEPCAHLRIEDCLVHDTEGAAIDLAAVGQPKAVFANVTVEHCRIQDAWSGIGFCAEKNYHTDFFPNFRVAHCVVSDCGADGITPFCGNHGVVEYCTAFRTGLGTCKRSPVGIWFAWAKDSVIQFCESFDNHTAGNKADGGGFDIDGGCTGCVLQYNYSHDNDGAGYLLCSWDPKEWPSTDCVCRYNLSINDGLANDYASIEFWQAQKFLVHNNTCVTRKASPLKFISADCEGHVIANNLFVVDSEADHPVVKSAFDISRNHFSNNLYWAKGGRLHFEVQEKHYRHLADFEKLVHGKDEVSLDPGFRGPYPHVWLLPADSPARQAGAALAQLGPHDYFGQPVSKPVVLGYAQKLPPAPAKATDNPNP
jgi:hypothetical protein